MISALFFLQFQSIKNRLLMRVRRLRQPKYLFGAIVGGAYFYFYFGRHFFGGRPAIDSGIGLVPEQFPFEMLAAFALFVIVISAWIFPHRRAALTFTEAEVAFLFPAPISRKMLIHFKLLKTQTGIFFTVLFLTLITRRFGSGGHAATHAAGWWIILSTLNLHFIGSSFARTLLLDRGISNWLRRAVVLILIAVIVTLVIVWGKNSLPPFNLAEISDLPDLARYAEKLFQSGPFPYLLFLFQLILKPFLASDLKAFFFALGPAMLVLALHYVWVIRSNVAFEEASVEASQKLAERVATVRSGSWQNATKPKKKSRAPFRLQPLGPRPIALLWKNLISAGQMFTLRFWIIMIWPAIFGAFIFGNTQKNSGIVVALGFFALILLFMSVIIGPQLLRQDFRQDLASIELLKLYPMSGWKIVLGEILAPIVMLTATQWLLLILALGFGAGIPSGKEVDGFIRVGMAFGIAVLLPMLNFILLLIPNAAVLLFPSWFQTGKDAPQGIEATGQRLIFMIGQVLILALAMLPAAGFFALVIFLCNFFMNPMSAIPIASVVASIVLAAEGSAGLFLLGKAFARFDLSAEMTN